MSTSLRNALKVTKQHSADGEQYLYTARVSEAWSNGGSVETGILIVEEAETDFIVLLCRIPQGGNAYLNPYARAL